MHAEPIKLVSDDEAMVILQVADDAARRSGWLPNRRGSSANPPMPKSISNLRFRYSVGSGPGRLITELISYFSPGTISRDDLILLAPYIDDWLNGNAPPFSLPAEICAAYPRSLSFALRQRVTRTFYP